MSRHERSARLRWAELRFSIIGTLLSSPPAAGELAERLLELSQRQYTHPSSGEPVRFGVSTIERWYYQARAAQQPIVALERKVPKHAGSHPSVSAALCTAIAAQHRQHPSWSYQLHYDNLRALADKTPALGPLPSYPTLRRYMKDTGLCRQARRRPKQRQGSDDGVVQVQAREVRSYEHAYVHGLWHLDFHEGSRKVLLPSGAYHAAHILAVLDDCSRLCCHAQWYLDNDTEALVHALCQAILKRGLPRALMSDNGGPMTAAETTEGLSRLSVLHHTTLPYSPEQNGKQESFWARIEGRLLPMLEGERALTLSLLNDATQAWVEQEYHRSVHSELGQTPLSRALQGPSVVRSSPSSDELRRAFKTECSRAQRKSDGTVSVEGVRFEVPSRYRTLARCTLRVARWDLRSIDLVDPHSGVHLATLLPLDKSKNADGRRRAIRIASAQQPEDSSGIAPLLRELMAQYSATGLPPAYLTQESDTQNTDPQENDES
jgi:transposase InsO family protein